MLKHLPPEFSAFLDHILTLDYFTKPDYQVSHYSFAEFVLFTLARPNHVDLSGFSFGSSSCQCLKMLWRDTMCWRTTSTTGRNAILRICWPLMLQLPPLSSWHASHQHTWGISNPNRDWNIFVYYTIALNFHYFFASSWTSFLWLDLPFFSTAWPTLRCCRVSCRGRTLRTSCKGSAWAMLKSAPLCPHQPLLLLKDGNGKKGTTCATENKPHQ